jgi:O-antigen/teichoic acid export membrane protein
VKKLARSARIQLLQERLTGSFSGRAGIVLLGSGLGQAIAFVLLPFLARVYSPDALGRAATTLAVLGVVGLLASLQYDQAVIVASDRDLPYVLLVATAIALVWTVLFAVLLLVIGLLGATGKQVLDTLGINGYLLPLILTYALFVLLTNYRLRENQLGRVGIGRVIYYGGGATFQVIGGYVIGGTESVFLVAQTAAALGAFLYLMPYRRVAGWLARHRPSADLVAAEMRRAAKTYSNFPKYQAGAQFLNALSAQIPVLVMRVAFSDAWAGWYFLAYRVLAAPTALLSQAVGQVYYRDSAERERSGAMQAQTLERITVGLIQISLVPALALGFTAPFLVGTFLGEEWLPVARIVQILLIPFVAAFFVSPISTLLNVKNRQRGALAFNALLFLGRTGTLLIAWLLGNPWTAVWGYALASLAVYLPFFAYVVRSVGASITSILLKLRPLALDLLGILVLAAILSLTSLLQGWLGVVLISGGALVVTWRELRRATTVPMSRSQSEIGSTTP